MVFRQLAPRLRTHWLRAGTERVGQEQSFRLSGVGGDVACLHYSSEVGAVALRGLYGGLEIF
jgi:phage baseplate assembly protein gpV